jgi:hypothetical protein
MRFLTASSAAVDVTDELTSAILIDIAGSANVSAAITVLTRAAQEEEPSREHPGQAGEHRRTLLGSSHGPPE